MTRILVALALLALVATITGIVRLRRASEVWSSEPYEPDDPVVRLRERGSL